jgi:hypothetical protein
MTVVYTRARLLEPRLVIAPYNKNGRILYYKVERPLLRRHLIKYKAYWTRLVSVVVGEQPLAITN